MIILQNNYSDILATLLSVYRKLPEIWITLVIRATLIILQNDYSEILATLLSVYLKLSEI